MKAMILAAGLGTRLRPLTLSRPKALIPVGNRPLIDWTIEYLQGHGIGRIIVNAHHYHVQIVRYLDRGRPFGTPMEVRVEPEILGTGGGIRNTADFWDDAPFVVINGDILTDINLSEAYRAHVESGALATLVLHHCAPFNQIQINASLRITDIADSTHPGRLAFTGIHILNPEILDHLPEGVFSSIVDCYRALIRKGAPLRAFISKGHYWCDVGTIQSYVLANREFVKAEPFLLGPHCWLHPQATLKGWAVVGKNAVLEERAKVKNSILWDHVKIKEGVKVTDSIVTSWREVESDLVGAVA